MSSVVPDEVKSMITSKTAVIIIVIIAAFIGLASVAFLGKDNPIEQEAEKVIEAETGIKLDITPQKVARKDGPWVPDNYPPEPPKGPNGPAEPRHYYAGPSRASLLHFVTVSM